MNLAISQKFGASCGLACISFIIKKSEEEILKENSDILSIEKLNFIGLYGFEIKKILYRYGKKYISTKYNSVKYESKLSKIGTIFFVKPNINYPIGHYYTSTQYGYMNPYNFRNKSKIPTSCFEKEIPGEIEWIIFEN